MATEDAGRQDSGGQTGETDEAASPDVPEADPARVDEYTWKEYLEEYGDEGDAEALYREIDTVYPEDDDEEPYDPPPTADDWEAAGIDPTPFLGFHPAETEERLGGGGTRAEALSEYFEDFCDPATTPVVKGVWMWEHYKREYYYEEDGSRPRDPEGEIIRFDKEDALGFDPALKENALSRGAKRAEELQELVDRRTVNVTHENEDAFFSNPDGTTTIANRYDLEKAVPMQKKLHFEEVERYWVNEPYAFVIVFHSVKENETKYYVVEPYMNVIEEDLTEFLTAKLKTAIKYADDEIIVDDDEGRQAVIENEAFELLERYDLYSPNDDGALLDTVAERLGVRERDEGSMGAKLLRSLGWEGYPEYDPELEGIAARPEPAILEEDSKVLTEYQVEKLLYYLTRDFIGYERIDGIKHDINVEDISCDGYNSPVFVYHSDYEQIISNVYHEEDELDDFVVKLAQRSGKGISKRRPQVDATLPDGSRAQLTLGREVSDHGTNYTIRQFKDVPFTPIDLINWHTFSLDEIAFLWLCIENNKSLIFAGGTASGKTTSLNAVSLFIPSNAKIVSIEDTREVELPQRNWIASVTRPSFTDDSKGDVDEFDLLEAALRQRPDYIVMGEIRGEEGRTLFQVMSTGHTTYTTFHADSVGEVLKRFTTEPINVSKTMFTALDLVSIQTSTRVEDNKVRRNKSITEINHYDAENDEINVQDVYQWQAETDSFLRIGDSNTLEDIKFDRGWTDQKLQSELFRRKVVLAYLIDRKLNTYTQVAATFQAFINDPETILTLMANDQLKRSLESLREMESVLIDIDPEKEEMVPRPKADGPIEERVADILDRAGEELFPEYEGKESDGVVQALLDVDGQQDVVAQPGAGTPTLDEIAETAATAAATEDEGGDDATGGGTADGDSGGGEDVSLEDALIGDDPFEEAAGDGGDDLVAAGEGDADGSEGMDEWGFGQFEEASPDEASDDEMSTADGSDDERTDGRTGEEREE
ncbi:MAG: ATPase, T2SS/T4P/T4SS family [Haloferacaceae archaeon]